MNISNDNHKNLGIDALGLARVEFPPMEYFLETWLAVPSLSMIWAQRGAGKTWVALSIAYAVASGGSFLSWKAPKPRRVCYLDGEMGRRAMQDRLLTIGFSNEIAVTEDMLRFVGIDDAPRGIIWNLADPQDQMTYSKIVENYDLIVVDNLATTVRAAGKGLSSDVEQWASVQQWAIQQRLKGKSIIFIHHAGKSGEQRGTSTREDVMDTVVGLRRDQDYQVEKGVEFTWRFEKARHLHGDQAQALRVNLKALGDGRHEWEWRTHRDHFKEQFTQLLKDGRSMVAIMERLQIKRAAFEELKERYSSEIEDKPRFNPGEDLF